MSLPIINVAIDFENNGTWVDVSSYFRSATIKRGSSRVESPIIRYEAGTAVLILDNSDRRFDPTNLNGPYTQPSGVAGSGIQQAQATATLVYGHGFTVAVASTDPETVEATLRSSASTTSNSTSFTCSKPTGTASGDILVAFQSGDWGSDISMGTPTGGATWSQLVGETQGSNTLHTKVWWKVAGGSEPSTYSFSQASASDGVVVIACVRDASGTPTYDSTDNNSTAFFSTPGITPAGDADYELRWVAGVGGGGGITWDWTSATGYTEAHDIQSNAFTTGSMAHKSLSGLVTTSGGSLVKPMRPVRIRAIWSSVTYDLFRGYIDSWDITWNGPNYSEVTVPCTDAFKIFSNIDRTATSSQGAGEASGLRIVRILDAIDWPSALRDIDTGDVALQATTLDGNVLEEMLLVAETEVGELYMTPDGKVFYGERSRVNDDTRSNTSQATFGDAGGSELPYQNLTFSYDDTQLYNRAIITRAGGAAQTADDTSSQNEFLLHSYERSELLMTDNSSALAYAQYVLSLSAQPELRFETITIYPQSSEADLFPQVLNRLIRDRITIRRRPPGGGDMIEKDSLIIGIEHEISPGQWITTWNLQSTAAAGSFFLIGNATRGRLDQNSLGF